MRRNPPSQLADIGYTLGALIILVFALVFVLRDHAWLLAGFVGLVGLGFGSFLLKMSKMMRDAEQLTNDAEEEQGGPRGPTEAMLAVDALDEAIIEARVVPFTDRIRLGRGRVDGLLNRLRSAPAPVPSEWGALLYELDALISGRSRSRSPTRSASIASSSTTSWIGCERASARRRRQSLIRGL